MSQIITEEPRLILSSVVVRRKDMRRWLWAVVLVLAGCQQYADPLGTELRPGPLASRPEVGEARQELELVRPLVR
jgi:hypothetical protein